MSIIECSNSEASEYKIVQLADKSTANILSSVELPIALENNTHLVTGNILPSQCTYLILELDSSYKMGLVINTADHTSDVS
jgi:hypothetical protein